MVTRPEPEELWVPLRELSERDAERLRRLRRFGEARGWPNEWAEKVVGNAA